MKKMLMAMTALALAGVAGAQTWPTDNGQFKLGSCYGIKEGVRCDLTFTLLKTQSLVLDVDYSNFAAFTTDGSKVNPTISLAGADWSEFPSDTQVFNGTPVKVSLLFNIPANVTKLSSLAIGNENIQNIPVRPLGAPAPAPATAAPAQTINIAGNWNATLTNCKQASAGVVVCTATLRK